MTLFALANAEGGAITFSAINTPRHTAASKLDLNRRTQENPRPLFISLLRLGLRMYRAQCTRASMHSSTNRVHRRARVTRTGWGHDGLITGGSRLLRHARMVGTVIEIAIAMANPMGLQLVTST